MTRQHDQVYSNKFGPPLGRPGNGLGTIAGWVSDVDSAYDIRVQRPVDRAEPEYDPQEATSSLEEAPQDFMKGITLDVLYDALKRLTARQSFVIRLRYGLDDGTVYTLGEIAEWMGVSNQAVSDLEQRALRTLEVLVINERESDAA